MKTVVCFFSGIGMPELMLLLMMAALVVVMVTIIRAFRRKPTDLLSHHTSNQSPILRHAEKLKVLKELQEKGVISNDEFEAEKKKLLES